MSTYIPNFLCDLHCHTTQSDGHITPKDFIKQAGSIGMKVVAITDHDIVPPEYVDIDGIKIDIIRYADSLDLKLVKGIEISCDTDVEDVHILGYGCDWKNQYFVELDEATRKSKLEGYRILIERLNEKGIMIKWDEIYHPEKGVQKKRIYELIAEKGHAKSWEYAKMWVIGTPELYIKRKKPNPAETIKSIHKAGGIAVLAHPFLIDEIVNKMDGTITRNEYIMNLIHSGLDGIEGSYTYDKTSYKGDLPETQILQEINKSYGHLVRVVTGGSDYHADEKTGNENARMIGECGISYEYLTSNPILYKLISNQTMISK